MSIGIKGLTNHNFYLDLMVIVAFFVLKVEYERGFKEQ